MFFIAVGQYAMGLYVLVGLIYVHFPMQQYNLRQEGFVSDVELQPNWHIAFNIKTLGELATN